MRNGRPAATSHSALELTRLMMGKNARVSFDVSTFDENLYGSCSPKYLETMLQEVYLVFQGSRKDERECLLA